MIWALNRSVQERLATWVKDEEVSDAVFRTMATIPMEWIGHTEREGLPYDVEEFFRRLREGRTNGTICDAGSVADDKVPRCGLESLRFARLMVWSAIKTSSQVAGFLRRLRVRTSLEARPGGCKHC